MQVSRRLTAMLRAGSMLVVAAGVLPHVSSGCGWCAEQSPGSSSGFGKASPQAAPLVGSWRLVSDDDKPGQTPPPEVITFGRDGRYSVAGSGEPFGGRYRVEGEEVVLTLVVDGNTRVMRRGFKLDAAGLHFANKVRGFAHYVRVKPAARAGGRGRADEGTARTEPRPGDSFSVAKPCGSRGLPGTGPVLAT